MKGKANIKIISKNKKAYFEYDILETFEAGMVLYGTEIKALREGRASLKDAYAEIRDNEVFLINSYIGPYSAGNINNHDEQRPRKLLLHKREIKKLIGKVAEKGLTLIPLKLYFIRGLAKVELALAKGKRVYDKRKSIMERDRKREMEREIKQSGKFA